MAKPAKEVRMVMDFSEFFDNLGRTKLKTEIKDLANLLKQKCPIGNPIPHNLWPKMYVQKYGITNLFRWELSDGWRLLYHIVGEPDGLVVYLIEALPHKEYEKRFKY